MVSAVQCHVLPFMVIASSYQNRMGVHNIVTILVFMLLTLKQVVELSHLDQLVFGSRTILAFDCRHVSLKLISIRLLLIPVDLRNQLGKPMCFCLSFRISMTIRTPTSASLTQDLSHPVTLLYHAAASH